jgi:hypothetical protein
MIQEHRNAIDKQTLLYRSLNKKQAIIIETTHKSSATDKELTFLCAISTTDLQIN